MKNITLYIVLLLLVMLSSCAPEPVRNRQLVVEGWISEGEPPVVMLHHSLIFDEKEDSIEELIANKIIKWANVTVDDGTQKVTLLAQMDSKLMPPVKYSTSKMFGIVGRTYTITVDYKEEHADAHTSLLQEVDIDSIVIKPLTNGGMEVKLYFDDCDDNVVNYYALFYKYLKNTQYLACPMGVCDNSKVDGRSLNINAYRRTATLVSDAVPTIQFNEGDSVFFKVCHVDEPSYRVWNSFSSQMLSPNVPIMSVDNIATNISGGLGYWCGLSGKSQFVIIKPGTIKFSN